MGMSRAQLVRQYGYARLTRWLKEYTNIFYGRASEEVEKKETKNAQHAYVSPIATLDASKR